ncbi:hypothetical protein [Sphingomonas sp. dw_22]|uniref:DUF4139 domain-containing protein n=1 Tax=Sphingomonas sp. dw_22 TaxID=2721175 RepID=UPI001BD5FE8E|nr:hypothetical protein [Sphingomonas sp. dw_22]
MRRIALALTSLLAAWPVAAQTLVESDRIDSTSVTLYRDPQRGEGAIRAGGWPGGYALVTETRTIRVPAGRSVIRFVGVSEGMLPETAIVTGLPRQVNEKNRDARLLSPAALIDAYLKRRVTIRRTDRATGKVREGEAVIQSGPGGGVVLTTADGVEALGCSGLPERLTYPGVPADLSARPTLSVTTDSAAAATVTVQLSYLAQGFDWSANYVARVADDGETLDLFAWLTVVNGGSQGFADANTNAVAGAPNKEAAAVLPRGPDLALHLRCWPMDTTSTFPRWGMEPPSPPAPAAPMAYAEDIVVTGMRSARMPMAAPVPAMVAQQEELGDLKLYRIPEPVTVAAQSRKQVAMIDRKKVRFERVYTGRFEPFDYDADGDGPESEAAARILRTENLAAKGLGLPLPAGGVAVFEQARGESLLVGESDLADRAVGEEVEFGTGESDDVRYRVVARPPSRRRQPFVVEVTNARATPETFELAIPYGLASSNAKLIERKGVKTWRVTVPANGAAHLEFALRLER